MIPGQPLRTGSGLSSGSTTTTGFSAGQLIKSNGSTVTYASPSTDYAPGPSLPNITRALSYISTASLYSLARIALIGDSWVDKILVDFVAGLKDLGIPVYGAGWVPAFQQPSWTSPIDGTTLTVGGSGTWTSVYVADGGAPNSPYGGVNITRSDGTNGATMTIVVPATSGANQINLHYRTTPGGGTFTWKMDAGATSGGISTNAAEGIVILPVLNIPYGTPGQGTHTLTITVTAGTVGIFGTKIDYTTATAGTLGGVIVYDVSMTGTTTLSWVDCMTAANNNAWQQGLADLNPNLAVVLLGTNDCGASRVPGPASTNGSYAANLTTIIGQIESAIALAQVNQVAAFSSGLPATGQIIPGADVLLVCAGDNGKVQANLGTYTMDLYRNAAQVVASASNSQLTPVGFLDLYNLLGPYIGMAQEMVVTNGTGGNSPTPSGLGGKDLLFSGLFNKQAYYAYNLSGTVYYSYYCPNVTINSVPGNYWVIGTSLTNTPTAGWYASLANAPNGFGTYSAFGGGFAGQVSTAAGNATEILNLSGAYELVAYGAGAAHPSAFGCTAVANALCQAITTYMPVLPGAGLLAPANNTLGYAIGIAVTSAAGNVLLGNACAQYLTTGNNNFVVCVGGIGANHLTTGSNNVLIGVGSQLLSTGSNNICIGSQAGQYMTTVSGNVCIGQAAGELVTGANNVAVGTNSCGSSGAGGAAADNVFLGYGAGPVITTGTVNVGIGYQACPKLTSGQGNVGIGNASLYSITTQNYNTAVGQAAGGNPSGAGNVFIGYNTANNNAVSTTNCTFIGNAADTSAGHTTASNSTAIGNGALVTADNQIVFGNSSIVLLNVPGVTGLPSGTIASPPGGLAVGDLWLDTTGGYTANPILRIHHG